MSTTFRWFVTATAITEINSAALRPTIAPPSTTPVAGSERIFDEAARVAVDQRLRVGRERHLRHPQLAARRERLGLGDADLGDLGIGEDRLRGLVVVEVTVCTRGESHHVLGDLAPLHRRDRRQRQAAGDVAGGVDVRQVRLAVPVPGNVTVVVDLDARGLAPESFAVRHRADAKQRVRRRRRRDRRRTRRSTLSSSRPIAVARAPFSNFTPRRRNSSSRTAATSGSLYGRTCWRDTIKRDPRAERAEHVRELDAGHTGSDDDEVVGDLGRRIRLAGREDALAVDRRPVGKARAAIRSTGGSRRPRAPRYPRRSRPRPCRRRRAARFHGSGARPATRAGS